MPARTAIVIAAGAGFTNVPVSIPAHRVVFVMSDPTLQIDYSLSSDAFVAVQSSAPNKGNKVIIQGPGAHGIIGRPANYSAKGFPASAEVMAKVRTTGNAGGTLIVTEYEGQSTADFE